jgi:hypothetical protein
MTTDTHYWRKEKARVERDWQAINGEAPHGDDWIELCDIADLEERANTTTTRTSAGKRARATRAQRSLRPMREAHP